MGSFMDKVYSMMGVDVGDTYEEGNTMNDYALQGGYDEPDPKRELYAQQKKFRKKPRQSKNRYEGQPSDETCYHAACKLLGRGKGHKAKPFKKREPIVINL